MRPKRPARGMALILQRADEGDARCVRVLAAAGEALGFAIANLITLFAPPKVIISGRAMATSEHFVAPLRKTVAALLPASLADVSDIVVRRMERRKLGARRRGDDAARSLWRALGNDRSGARSRAAFARCGRIVMKRVGVGVIGCGNISSAYLTAAKKFPILDIVALSDANPAAAEARGGGVRASRRARSTRFSPIRRSRSFSTSPSPRRMSRSASRRSPRASTSTRKSRSASTSPKRASSSRRRRPRACASAARPTRSSAAPTRPRADASTRG